MARLWSEGRTNNCCVWAASMRGYMICNSAAKAMRPRRSRAILENVRSERVQLADTPLHNPSERFDLRGRIFRRAKSVAHLIGRKPDQQLPHPSGLVAGNVPADPFQSQAAEELVRIQEHHQRRTAGDVEIDVVRRDLSNESGT